MQNVTLTINERIVHFKDLVESELFTRKDYLRAFKEISPATASRDLKFAVDDKIIKKKWK